ncbi:MAG: response regulator [Candidatus Margulisbacteria bacterium]|nr:response regulator [Candidatus Margulisiibacteriota bacterium]
MDNILNIGLKPNGKPYNFFVIDDSKAMVKMISAALAGLGGEIIGSALNGQEALPLIEQLKDQIDCITCDINMPGMDGITLLPRIRSINPQIKIIMISAMGHAANKTKAKILGAKHFLMKPFQKEQMYVVLKELFNLRDTSTNQKMLSCQGNPLGVFIVETAAVNATILKNLLVSFGCKIIGSVLSGSDAFAEIQMLKNQINVILVDVNLPDMNGMDFIAEIKKLAPALNIVAFSGEYTPDFIRDAKICGAASALKMPTDKDTLLDTLSAIYPG